MNIRNATAAAMAATLIVACAGPARALDTCRAKIRGKDGLILISAKNVDGTPQWGWNAGSERNPFSDPACTNGSTAKNCTQGSATSLLAITPPPECRIFLADNSGSCTAYVRKCQPGRRPVVEFPTRYVVRDDGTVTDTRTGLMWERKTDDGSVHDKDNAYNWSTGAPYNPDGAAFFTFLAELNGPTPFAGYGDWRLPTITELQAIVDLSAPGCGLASPCINETVFGPAQADVYWSTTTAAARPEVGRVFALRVAVVDDGDKTVDHYVRAVRGGP